MIATVREVDGQIILNDPDALVMVRAIGKHNCRATFEAQADLVAHFVRRMRELGRPPEDLIIVLLNVDTPLGAELGELLMPGHDWAPIRARGEVPFARGLATRADFQEMLDDIDRDSAEKLRGLGTAVLVVDYGVIEVFEAE